MSLTQQQILDRVTTHLLTQGEKSHDGYGGRYKFDRTEYGEPVYQCAIGCLITDDAYTIHLEDSAVMSPKVLKALVESEVFDSMAAAEEQIGFLDALQVVHDDFDPAQWANKLQQVADDYALTLNLPVNNANQQQPDKQRAS